MTLSPDEATQIWRVPGGEARFTPETRSWWHTGLERPVQLEGSSEPQLAPTLGTSEVVLHLSTPLRILPGSSGSLAVAWPVVHEVRLEDQAIEHFRPIMRRTMLGSVASGRVLPGYIGAVLDGSAPPEGHARLHIRYQHGGQEPATIRRVAFDESLLTLSRDGDALLAGVVLLRLFDQDDASTTAEPLPVPSGGQILRAGRAVQPTDRSGLRWWIDGTRRSMGFRL